MSDPFESAASLAARIATGEISAVEATKEALDRISALDDRLNAFITVDADGACKAARERDRDQAAGRPCGPLHGVPVAIKDVTATAGLRTTQGSTIFADRVPDRDEESVARLRRAGAVIVGKTNTPEFAFGAVCTNMLCGPTRNPWDPTRTSGGSSGGSAVTVATGMVPLAQGTDFGGSVRMPASFCGIVGLRPAPGTIAEPDRALGWGGLATQGVLARCVADTVLMLRAMAGPHPLDPLSRRPLDLDRQWPERPRIAASLDLGGAFPVDDAVAQAFEEAITGVQAALGPASRGAPPMEGAAEAFKTMRAAESFYRSGAFVETHEARLSPSFVWNVRQGRGLTAADYLKADAVRTRVWRDFIRFFEDFDLLVMPTCAVLPFPNDQEEVLEVGGRKLMSIIDYLACTFLISLVGFPALSLPAPRAPGALPFGLQLIVPPGREAVLFALARRLEQTGFRHAAPPVMR
ncbi:amidase [Breoghania corrubedonensis]|uniref:Indoleacetamide hydrolase n=1 Tax=Breoghania corrubedonensis TaxID=665038 RepID=A0A2T5V6D4_9HYPH|nr:amidase [Breoghania corrubedonensis]PTW59317.1 amidase [Breoghania corrubedonensis]